MHIDYLSVNLVQFKQRVFKKANLLYSSNKLPWLIICFGVILRVVQYLFNRSLTLDEANNALNIINGPFSELLQHINASQTSPLGFLITEKFLVQIFGDSEYVLRLFPLLCGVISLFLFYKVAMYYIETKAVPIALGLFAISEFVTLFSSELKSYSSDVAIALLLYLLTYYIWSKGLSVLHIALFGIIGAIAVWFSYPAVFVLAGVGTVLGLSYLLNKEWPKIGRLLIIYSIWILSFTLYYFIFVTDIGHDEELLNYWRDSFAPFPPMTLSDVKWFLKAFFDIFKNPVGLRLNGIAALTFIIGCVTMCSDKKKRALILISPIFFTLLASGLHKYPFSERLLLFIVPAMLLFISEGTRYIIDKTKLNPATSIIRITLVGLLFFHPVADAFYYLTKPHVVEEIKPVISYVRKHQQSGDVLYIYYGAQRAFEYYSKRYGFNTNDYIKGVSSRENWGNYISDLNKLRGNKRVWILFSHVCWWKGVDEEKFFLYHLDSIGRRIDSFKSPGAAVYLYDLRENSYQFH